MTVKLPLFLFTAVFFCQCIPKEKVLVPRQADDYIRIYKAAGDKFFGFLRTMIRFIFSFINLKSWTTLVHVMTNV